MDREAVKAAKDGAVARLRAAGLEVYEEVEATTLTSSLGFVIDGSKGLLHPKPDKWKSVINVFSWLGSRPHIYGNQLERAVGHAIHFMMLRRELLCLFRAC